MEKCAQYWPANENETQTYGDVTVTNSGSAPLTDEETTVRVTKLTVKWKLNGKDDSREIKHFQCKAAGQTAST